MPAKPSPQAAALNRAVAQLRARPDPAPRAQARGMATIEFGAFRREFAFVNLNDLRFQLITLQSEAADFAALVGVEPSIHVTVESGVHISREAEAAVAAMPAGKRAAAPCGQHVSANRVAQHAARCAACRKLKTKAKAAPARVPAAAPAAAQRNAVTGHKACPKCARSFQYPKALAKHIAACQGAADQPAKPAAKPAAMPRHAVGIVSLADASHATVRDACPGADLHFFTGAVQPSGIYPRHLVLMKWADPSWKHYCVTQNIEHDLCTTALEVITAVRAATKAAGNGEGE